MERIEILTGEQRPSLVILPFLTAVKSRGYAAINGGFPPLALCGRVILPKRKPNLLP
jgi:hypothetical protein